MLFLRQSTASQEILLGPFLDDTDGKTAETGLTIANTDIKLWKEGGTTESNKNSGGGTHVAGGRYTAVLDATDSDTLGKLELNIHVAGALPVRREFMVLSAVVYDSLVLGTDKLQTDVVELNGVSQSLLDLVDFADAGYDPATNKVQNVALVDTLTTYTGNTPQTGDVFPLASTEIADIKAKTDNLPSDPADQSLIIAATDAILARLPASLIAGRMDSSVGAMATGVIDAAAIAADAIGSSELAASAITEIQAGLATSAAQTTAQTDLDDIQTRLPAALVSGRMDSSVGAMAADVITAAALAASAKDEIVDQVWDELLSGHVIVGSSGAALAASGSAGDPWIAPLPGVYGAGTAGKIVGDNLNATVSSRAAAATALSTVQWTNARAGYLDNLNTGGLEIATPEVFLRAGVAITYTVEMRTYSANGALVNADANPTLTATGKLTGNLNANISAISNPSAGLYRWTYTVPISHTIEEIRFDGAATVATIAHSITDYTQVSDDAATLLDSIDGVETNYSLRQLLRVMHSIMSGKTTVTGTNPLTITFRNKSDNKNRVIVTFDPTDAQREAVVFDLT